MENWVTLTGRPARINIVKYLIDWDAVSLSLFQKRVKDFLRPYWEKTKVVLEEVVLPGSRMSVDFINVTDKIAVEVQGAQHQSYNEHLHDHSEANYRAQLKRDLSKARWCQLNGLTLVEVFPSDLPLSTDWFKEHYQIIL